MIIRVLIVAALVLAIGWGRSNTPGLQYLSPVTTYAWSEKHALWHRAWAGPVPGFAADLAVLNIFNIYAQATEAAEAERPLWWASMKFQLQLGQEMDPYFRDIYRLTEGLLAYEAKDMKSAVQILSRSEPYLHSSDPLLVAAFIAHQELKNDSLAQSLAIRATEQEESSELALGFASNIIKGQSGCKSAVDFLRSRLENMPEKYQQGIKRRIKRLQEGEECQGEIQGLRS